MAEDMTDADAKSAMLLVAENYEKIAKRAEAVDVERSTATQPKGKG